VNGSGYVGIRPGFIAFTAHSNVKGTPHLRGAEAHRFKSFPQLRHVCVVGELPTSTPFLPPPEVMWSAKN
jgi:hypothetical protein